MLKSAQKFLKAFAEQVLGIDETSVPTSHLRLFEDYLGKNQFDTGTEDVKKFFAVLKKKHLVDNIVVAGLNGCSIASTNNGGSIAEAVTGAALFNYVKSEIPKSEALMVKSAANSGWHMIFPSNKKLYIVKASSDLSMVELRALAKEIESFLAGKEPD